MDSVDFGQESTWVTAGCENSRSVPSPTRSQDDCGTDCATTSWGYTHRKSFREVNFFDSSQHGNHQARHSIGGSSHEKMKKNDGSWLLKTKYSVGFPGQRRDDHAPVARVEPIKVVKNCQINATVDNTGESVADGRRKVPPAWRDSNTEKSDISSSSSSGLAPFFQQMPSRGFQGPYVNTLPDTFATYQEKGQALRDAFDYTPRKPFDLQEKAYSQEPEIDGTELDFNVVVFSQDEADSRDSNSPDFLNEKYFSYVKPTDNVQLPQISTQDSNEQLQSASYNISPLKSQQEPLQNGAHFTSGALQMLQGYGDEKQCSLHLEISGRRSESPNFIMKLSSKSDSPYVSNVEPNTDDGGFAILNTMYDKRQAPSQIKIDSQLKKDQYMKNYSQHKREPCLKTPSKVMYKVVHEEVKKSPLYQIPQHSTALDFDTMPMQVQGCGLVLSKLINARDRTPKVHNAKRIFNSNCSSERYTESTAKSPLKMTAVEPTKKYNDPLEWRPMMNPNRCSEEMRSMRQAFRPTYDETGLATTAYSPGFIDSHCHLDFLFQRASHAGTLSTYRLKCKDGDAFPVSYEGCVAVFCEPWTFRKISWWEELISESNIWAAFGCHPHYVSKFNQMEEGYLKFALQNSKVVALGEIGLDYSERNNENQVLQHEVFRNQLKIALEYKKPIVIHCRDAHRDCINILKEMVPSDHVIHRHCFTDSWEEAQEWLESFCNLYLGFTGLVTQSSRRGRIVRDVVKRIPLNRILLETDAPYFRPLIPGLSHPGMAIHVAAQIASVKNIDIQLVLRHARENTYNMYGI